MSEQSERWEVSKKRSERFSFGRLKKHEFVLMQSTEPKWMVAGVQTLSKMIIDFHHVIIPSNHMIGLSTLGIILKGNYINFLVKCRVLESLFTRKICELELCLCIAEAS